MTYKHKKRTRNKKYQAKYFDCRLSEIGLMGNRQLFLTLRTVIKVAQQHKINHNKLEKKFVNKTSDKLFFFFQLFPQGIAMINVQKSNKNSSFILN